MNAVIPAAAGIQSLRFSPSSTGSDCSQAAADQDESGDQSQQRAVCPYPRPRPPGSKYRGRCAGVGIVEVVDRLVLAALLRGYLDIRIARHEAVDQIDADPALVMVLESQPSFGCRAG